MLLFRAVRFLGITLIFLGVLAPVYHVFRQAPLTPPKTKELPMSSRDTRDAMARVAPPHYGERRSRAVARPALSRCAVALPPHDASKDAVLRVRRVYLLIGPEIKAAAAKTGLDCNILISKIAQECGAVTTREALRACRSKSGALGPVQMLPSTAHDEFGATRQDLLDIEKNVELGARYLKRQLERTGSMPLAIIAYYAGEGGMRSWLRSGKHAEEHPYLRGVLLHAHQLGFRVH